MKIHIGIVIAVLAVFVISNLMAYKLGQESFKQTEKLMKDESTSKVILIEKTDTIKIKDNDTLNVTEIP